MRILFSIGMIGALGFGLFFLSNTFGVSETALGDTRIPCLPEDTTSFHTHELTLRVVKDGALVQIPSMLGVSETCTAPIHTRDASGIVYIETPTEEHEYVLEDLFLVWGIPLTISGYSLSVEADGNPISRAPHNTPLTHQSVVLIYSKQ